MADLRTHRERISDAENHDFALKAQDALIAGACEQAAGLTSLRVAPAGGNSLAGRPSRERPERRAFFSAGGAGECEG